MTDVAVDALKDYLARPVAPGGSEAGCAGDGVLGDHHVGPVQDPREEQVLDVGYAQLGPGLHSVALELDGRRVEEQGDSPAAARTAALRALGVEPFAEMVEFAGWIALRSGRPKPEVRALLQEGKVSVAGSVWRAARIPRRLLERVVLVDGEQVV